MAGTIHGTFPCTWGSARLLGSVISCIRVTGMQYEVKAFNPDGSGTLLWAYCKGPTGPRIELVSRAMEPFIAYWFATCAD